jgi:hypothetical protein
MLRVSTFLAFAAILSAVVACGGDGAERPTSKATTAATPRGVAQRDRPVRVIDVDLNSCQGPAGADERLRVVAHEKAAEKHVEPVEAALTKAIDYASGVYGWTPSEPVCVHMFASDNAYLQGLQELGRFPPSEAFDYRKTVGTVGFDGETGRDAIFMNTVIPLGVNWEPHLATHEYFHVVQRYVGGTAGGDQYGLPSWFLEGMAELEAAKLQGEARPTWLVILMTDERGGRSHPLSALVTWDQWRGIERGASPYFKARAMLMLLERTAGPEAAAEIMRRTANSGPNSFERVFEEVAETTVQDMESGLLAFLEQLYLEQFATPPAQ